MTTRPCSSFPAVTAASTRSRGSQRSQVIGLPFALVDHHFLIHGAPIPDDLLTGIVDGILLPLLAQQSQPPGPGDPSAT